MIVGIHQPNYLPWLGYFRKIAMSDVFVFFDNIRMPGGKSFISRNAIKTPAGRQWLTVPIRRNGLNQPIAGVEIADQHWQRKHLRSLRINYSQSAWKQIIDEEIAGAFEARHSRLADLNIDLVMRICDLLGLKHTSFRRASTLPLTAEGADSVQEILAVTDAQVYVTGSGSGTTRHLDPSALAVRGVKVQFVSDEFPQYPQLHGAFVANLSVVDALLNCGPERTRAMLLAG